MAVYLRAMPSRPLVVAANRDELYARPSTDPNVITHDPWIVAGQDLTAGGTWLGLNRNGMVAGLLNRRSERPPDTNRRSRGLLCFEMLQDGDPAAALAHVRDSLRASDYNPFNLLLATIDEAHVVSNDGDHLTVTALPPGVHVLTNLAVNDPTCPRAAGSFQHFARVARDDYDDDLRLVPALRSILSSHALLLDPRHPDRQNTLCVHSPSYGTRSSSVITIDARKTPRYWHASGPPCTTDFVSIALPTSP